MNAVISSQKPLAAEIDGWISELHRGGFSAEDLIGAIERHCRSIDMQGLFKPWLDALQEADSYPVYETSRHGWTLSLWIFRLAANTCHPPHAHHSLASVQFVLEGCIHLIQYERVRRIDPLSLVIRKASDVRLAVNDCILTTEWRNNVHWFGAEELPSVIVNINATGPFGETFEKNDGRPLGRYYLDPTEESSDDVEIIAREISLNEATTRFSMISGNKVPRALLPLSSILASG